VDAASYGFRTFVVEDCVYDRTESTHAINLFDMDQKYARVLEADEVLRWWQ
jgi:isochorismate hydrolase